MKNVEYRELWKEDNARVAERYGLAMERIGGIREENQAPEPFWGYFALIARFAGQIGDLAARQINGEVSGLSLEEMAEENRKLYEDILPEHYEESYANPAYAAKMMGAEFGPLLAAFTPSSGELSFLPMNAVSWISLSSVKL